MNKETMEAFNKLMETSDRFNKVPEHNSSLIYWENGTIPLKDCTEQKCGISVSEAFKLLKTKGGIAFEVYFMNCELLGLMMINRGGNVCQSVLNL